ncbi:hypothetical protein MK786_03110 [Microbacterium sp. CFH 31415]|uniref:hypothetical protein n=1 Tax=Microbacterium sp. CFH 31415 TaxID=2921732 RepID=UPI001F1403DC|nr:hypothetical protein [Microbacterium sp. CFH 31415]MCH6229720.1 hypothetical protein [Microbacterium sp. CFH 31415]
MVLHNQWPTLEAEVDAARACFEDLIRAYEQLGESTRIGDIQQAMYDDLVHFTNLRIETATSVALLAESERVADGLGLCRSLLEHLLLLRLMARGRRYLNVGPPVPGTGSDFRRHLEEEKRKLADARARGEAGDFLDVEQYPRGGPRRLVWIREGLKNEDEPDFYVSIHYFLFKEFRPNVHRLNQAQGLAMYLPKGDARIKQLRKSRERFRAQARDQYNSYLSWSALLLNLEYNGLLSKREHDRVEAHYTYLGQFLHPTTGAAQSLHDPDNTRSGRARVGFAQPYDRRSVLLALLYAIWLTTHLLDEIANMLETAPPRYISDPGTSELRVAINHARERFQYFWFIDNDTPLWDRFNYAVHHVSDDELERAGGYAGIDSDEIPFPWDAYQRLKTVLGNWSNTRVGEYRSPLGP